MTADGVTRESEGGIGPRCDALISPLSRAVSLIVAQRLGCQWLRSAPCAKGVRFVREPDAGNLHVRFDERDVETERWFVYSGTVRRKGRQQTTANLRPPRHISTLPFRPALDGSVHW
jgi:hypothetical protein